MKSALSGNREQAGLVILRSRSSLAFCTSGSQENVSYPRTMTTTIGQKMRHHRTSGMVHNIGDEEASDRPLRGPNPARTNVRRRFLVCFLVVFCFHSLFFRER